MQNYINHEMIKKKKQQQNPLKSDIFTKTKQKRDVLVQPYFSKVIKSQWNTNLTSISDLDPSLTLTSDLDITAKEQTCIT